MNTEAYRAVRSEPNQAGVYPVPRAFIRLTGRDRSSFLQGQVSNDVLTLTSGAIRRACLLNNTGHLLADLTIHATDDALLIETDLSRGPIVAQTLERYLVREKVVIEDVTTQLRLVTVQGADARRVVTEILRHELPSAFHAPNTSISVEVIGDFTATLVKRDRLGAPDGYDLVLSTDDARPVMEALLAAPGVFPISERQEDVLRVEAGKPKWDAELDESVIPLEAGMDDAISYTKGCYMGQEVIARIHSRGHTNRSLRGLTMSALAASGEKLIARDGDRAGQEIGRITSCVTSPKYVVIALGYVRNEYAEPGTRLTAGEATATVAALPFVEKAPRA